MYMSIMNIFSLWLSGVLGLVVATVPFLELSETTVTWTLVAAGLVIMLSSFWVLIVTPTNRRSHGASRV